MIEFETLTEYQTWWLMSRDTFYIYKRIVGEDVIYFWSAQNPNTVERDAKLIYHADDKAYKHFLEDYKNFCLEVKYKSSTQEERLAGIKYLNSQMKQAAIQDDFE